MKTPEEILTEHGLWNYADNISLTRDRLISLMTEYAVQFIHPTKCYNCDGTGMVSHTTCVHCSGKGIVILLPTITTTGT